MFKPTLTLTFASLLIGSLISTASNAEELQKIRFGNGNKAVTVSSIDIVVPEYLGYFRSEGMTVTPIPLGSQSALFAALEKKGLEFSIATSDVQVPMVGNGAKLPTIDFFEYNYPFKYGMAVKPGSSIKKFSDLKGKNVGVRGVDEIPIGKAVARLAVLDPDKDISWLTVGDGVAAGIAVQRGDVDALFSFDVVFGTIEAADIKMDYLPLPTGIPMIAGNFLTTTPVLLHEHRQWAVGFARAVAKAHIFINENPEAASYILAKAMPEAVPVGKSIQEQVKSVLAPVKRRMTLYYPYDKTAKLGSIKRAEWEDQIKFSGFEGKIKDPSIFFTNEIVDDANKFDPATVKTDARNFKLPYKN